MNEVLLTLIATPEVEEKLVDWLLAAGHDGFTTLCCQGHGVQHGQLSASEQVAGRQQRVAFWLQTSESQARAVVSELGSSFASGVLHYWITPALAGGAVTARHDS
jgi:hypothetical protein